jgi:oligopeptide transport system ATP-binding protein
MDGVNGPALEVDGLKKHFPVGSRFAGRGQVVYAVDGLSFSIAPGEMLGLVGESGSGKSTVGNCILRLLEPTDGTIRLLGTDITHISRRAMRPLRRQLHMVFQDPYSSLNPRMTCGQIVGEALRMHRSARGGRLDEVVAELFN